MKANSCCEQTVTPTIPPADQIDICTLGYSDETDLTIRRFHVKRTVQSKLMTADSQSSLTTLPHNITVTVITSTYCRDRSMSIVIRLWTGQTAFDSRQRSGVTLLSLHPKQLCCPCKLVPYEKRSSLLGRIMTGVWT